jgi:hypothetical protein
MLLAVVTSCALLAFAVAKTNPAPSRSASITRTATQASTITASRTPSASATPVDWLQHGFTAARTYNNPLETVLNPTSVAGLSLLWKTAVSGVSIASPLLVHGISVLVNGSPVIVDVVFAGTEQVRHS